MWSVLAWFALCSLLLYVVASVVLKVASNLINRHRAVAHESDVAEARQ